MSAAVVHNGVLDPGALVRFLEGGSLASLTGAGPEPS